MVPVNAANLLTLVRIALVPVVIVLLVGEGAGPLPLATAVFALAALTDAADGHLARSRDMITTFGRLMDPLADKLLVGGALISLVAIVLLMLVPDAGAAWVGDVMLAVVAITVASGLEYALSYACRTADAPPGAVRVSAW